MIVIRAALFRLHVSGGSIPDDFSAELDPLVLSLDMEFTGSLDCVDSVVGGCDTLGLRGTTDDPADEQPAHGCAQPAATGRQRAKKCDNSEDGKMCYDSNIEDPPVRASGPVSPAVKLRNLI